MSHRISVVAPGGVGEVGPGDDLADLVLAACDEGGITPADGDILTITSKVVSKAEGRHRVGNREDAIREETLRVVARRGSTTIVRNRLGLTMAAAGIDASNVAVGQFLLLPEDPDASARSVRAALHLRRGVNLGVLVTDTAGRPWRDGQTDIAIGAAGLVVLEDFADMVDGHGNPLAVTAPAVGDELAGLSELASGKLSARPFTLITGRADLVLPPGDHGTGAGVLVREDGADMFGLGAREAVVRALAGTGCDAFGAPASVPDMAAAVEEVFRTVVVTGSVVSTTGRDTPDVARTADVLARAFGWQAEVFPLQGTDHAKVTFQPVTP